MQDATVTFNLGAIIWAVTGVLIAGLIAIVIGFVRRANDRIEKFMETTTGQIGELVKAFNETKSDHHTRLVVVEKFIDQIDHRIDRLHDKINQITPAILKASQLLKQAAATGSKGDDDEETDS